MPSLNRPAHYSLTVSAAQAGTRLDVLLSRNAAGLSRSFIARLIHDGHASVQGRTAKPGLVLKAGDVVALTVPPPSPSTLAKQNLPLAVLYEDEHLAVVDKPAGMVTHPAPGHAEGTLVNALMFHLSNLSGIGGEQRPGIVHRLDKDTSGLLLVAKHDEAHRRLTSGISNREVQRGYEAVVWGCLGQVPCSIETRLGRDPKNRKRFCVVKGGGRLASTWIESQQCFDALALIRIKLNTGRTHQIRIHCRYLGHPIVGDRTYGRRGEASALARLGWERPERQLLHARRLEFTHPFTGRLFKFEAPWPDDFSGFVRQMNHPAASRRVSGYHTPKPYPLHPRSKLRGFGEGV